MLNKTQKEIWNYFFFKFKYLTKKQIKKKPAKQFKQKKRKKGFEQIKEDIYAILPCKNIHYVGELLLRAILLNQTQK